MEDCADKVGTIHQLAENISFPEATLQRIIRNKTKQLYPRTYDTLCLKLNYNPPKTEINGSYNAVNHSTVKVEYRCTKKSLDAFFLKLLKEVNKDERFSPESQAALTEIYFNLVEDKKWDSE